MWNLFYSAFYFNFFFNDTATTEIYTLSLHDALPICSNSLSDIYVQLSNADIIQFKILYLK